MAPRVARVRPLTSATPTSNHGRYPRGVMRVLPQRPARHFSAGGFSLIEILVVVAIVGILAGSVVLAFSGRDQRLALRTEAQELALRIELARRESLQRNREWGLYFDDNDYRFAEYDAQAGRWQQVAYRPFQPGSLTAADRVTVRTEGVLAEALTDEKQGNPQVLMFSSGEQTPFVIRLEQGEHDQRSAWMVHSDGLGRTEAEQVDGVL